MEGERFREYEPIIRYSLDLAKFNEPVIILPGKFSNNNIFVRSQWCKTCLIDAQQQDLIVMMPRSQLVWYTHEIYEVISQVNLRQPDSLEYLGKVLSEILLGWKKI